MSVTYSVTNTDQAVLRLPGNDPIQQSTTRQQRIRKNEIESNTKDMRCRRQEIHFRMRAALIP